MSGFLYTFVSQVPQEYVCIICQCPMRKPVQTKCGHRFCKYCLQESMRRLQECPIDRNRLDKSRATDIYPDVASERTILDFQVKCPNENNGCKWIGELRSVEAHEKTCSFERITCTNDYCDVVIRKKDLINHLDNECPRRRRKCAHCKESYVWCRRQDHFKECSRFPCTCVQTCGQSNIPRNEMNDHIKRVCPLTKVDCTFAHVGCQVKVPRNGLSRHVQANIVSHLNLSCKTLQELQAEHDAKTKELQAKHEATKTQLQELQAEHDYTKTQMVDLQDEHDDTKTQMEQLQAEHDATIKQMEELQAAVAVTSQRNVCSEFIWKLTKFEQRLKNAKDGIQTHLYSNSFHTGPYGYKMCVSIDPNGHGPGENTHLSVYLHLQRGEYDAILAWPFNQKVMFALVDQQEDLAQAKDIRLSIVPGNETGTGAFAKPSSDRNIGYGFPKFISHNELQTRRYLVDDTLFIQVKVEQDST